ncbi:MAG TPA: pyridoxamine 5'-phosphate oxidase family protein [Trebonia sp.]
MQRNDQAGRAVVELGGPKCWKLLESVPLGRVVFSERAMPAIQVVSHLVDDGAIIVRSPHGTAIAGTGKGTVVCYEADDMDPDRRTGWSVVVTGLARLISDPATAARYSRLLPSWAPGIPGDLVVIEPGMVTGRCVRQIQDAALAGRRPREVSIRADRVHVAVGN